MELDQVSSLLTNMDEVREEMTRLGHYINSMTPSLDEEFGGCKVIINCLGCGQDVVIRTALPKDEGGILGLPLNFSCKDLVIMSIMQCLLNILRSKRREE